MLGNTRDTALFWISIWSASCVLLITGGAYLSAWPAGVVSFGIFWILLVGFAIVLMAAVLSFFQRFSQVHFGALAIISALIFATLYNLVFKLFVGFTMGPSTGIKIPEAWFWTLMALATYSVFWNFLRIYRREEKEEQEAASNDTAFSLSYPSPIEHIEASNEVIHCLSRHGQEVRNFPFSSALEMLSDQDGMRVHKDHWVAYKAVESTDWVDGALFLILSNGTYVPVSQTYQKRAALRFVGLTPRRNPVTQRWNALASQVSLALSKRRARPHS